MDDFSPFMIEIEGSKLVAVLKNKIKEAQPALARFAANHLRLYRVEIPTTDDIQEAARRAIAENPTELLNVDALNDVFVGGPKRKTIHIIVQHPKSGK